MFEPEVPAPTDLSRRFFTPASLDVSRAFRTVLVGPLGVVQPGLCAVRLFSVLSLVA